MPLVGFNDLKRRTIKELICANNDSGMGESVTYIFRNGDQVPFDAQVSFESSTDVEKNTNLRLWDITVLIMKEYLNYQEPQIGDKLVVRDTRWVAGVRTDREGGREHGTEASYIEEGTDWWRVRFVAEHLATKQVMSRQGR